MDVSHLTVPAIFAIVGAVLLVSSVAQLPTPWGPFGATGGRMRGASAVGGIVLILAAVYVYQHQPSPAIQGTPIAPAPQSATQAVTPPLRSADPEALIQVIKDKQHENVGDSTGTLDYQGFTDAKLAEFKKADVPAQVTAELKGDASFIDLVLEIKALQPSARQSLLVRAANTYRQPWSQLALDPSTAPKSDLLRGQTAAGSEAEREVARSIVALVKDLSQRPEDALKKLYP